MEEDKNTPRYEHLKSYYDRFATLALLNKIMLDDFKFNRYQVLKSLIHLICIDNFPL